MQAVAIFPLASSRPFGHGCGELPPVVMTTALNADSVWSLARNASSRRVWAAQILSRWMRETPMSVVVADATARKEDMEFLRALAPTSRLELLPLKHAFRSDLPPAKSKGYKEYRSIKAAAAHSQLLRNCSHFAHATGTRFVQNAYELLAHRAARDCLVGLRPPLTPVGLWMKGSVGLHRPDGFMTVPPAKWEGAGGVPSLKSDFVLWTREFLNDYFEGESVAEECPNGDTTQPECGYFENILAHAAVKAMRDGRKIHWFWCVHLHGWSGSLGRPQYDIC